MDTTGITYRSDHAMRLFSQRYGSGPPLIILHGLFGSSTNWTTISKHLSDQFEVIAVDQRNHGNSPHTDAMSYPLMADDLRDLLQYMQLPAAHVLGHSMGGKTAMQCALQYPELVNSLIVVDIAPKRYPPHHDHIFNALFALDLAACSNRAALDQQLAQYLPDVAERQFLLTNITRDAAGQFVWKIDLAAIRRNYPALVDGIAAPASFAKPTLFLRGERSNYIANSDRSEITALFPQATIETVPNAGHWVHAEAPDAFVQHVRVFLGS